MRRRSMDGVLFRFLRYDLHVPGRVYTEIFEIATGQYGYITATDAAEAGFDVRRLNDLKARGQAEHLDVGLYRLNAIAPTRFDPYMQATLWHHKTGVISHDTALDLWDVSNINPGKIHITIPFKPRLTRKPPPLYVVHKERLPDHDRTVLEGIPIVTLEKAIRQSAAAHARPDLLWQAIDNGRRDGKLRTGVADELVDELGLYGARR